MWEQIFLVNHCNLLVLAASQAPERLFYFIGNAYFGLESVMLYVHINVIFELYNFSGLSTKIYDSV